MSYVFNAFKKRGEFKNTMKSFRSRIVAFATAIFFISSTVLSAAPVAFVDATGVSKSVQSPSDLNIVPAELGTLHDAFEAEKLTKCIYGDSR